jgi:hypothetical protein
VILIKLLFGQQGVLNVQNEKIVVTHIQWMESLGFAPELSTVHRLAFQFAKTIGLKNINLTRKVD